MTTHNIVTRGQWLEGRRDLIAPEKDLTQRSDQVARLRQNLPWVHVDRDYVFDAPKGRRTLADLFEGRRQLPVQHFMFAPGWEQGCPSCSFRAQHVDGMTVYLAHRDVSLEGAWQHRVWTTQREIARINHWLSPSHLLVATPVAGRS